MYGPQVTRTPPAGRILPAPAINASVASHGEMWITLMHTTASAADTGQGRFVTSMARGGFTFDRLPAAAHASMEAWRSTSISLGWKVRAGKAFAKCATCCPVPLPISSTRPRDGKTRASTSRIGCLLRSGEGVHAAMVGECTV